MKVQCRVSGAGLQQTVVAALQEEGATRKLGFVPKAELQRLIQRALDKKE